MEELCQESRGAQSQRWLAQLRQQGGFCEAGGAVTGGRECAHLLQGVRLSEAMKLSCRSLAPSLGSSGYKLQESVGTSLGET